MHFVQRFFYHLHPLHKIRLLQSLKISVYFSNDLIIGGKLNLRLTDTACYIPAVIFNFFDVVILSGQPIEHQNINWSHCWYSMSSRTLQLRTFCSFFASIISHPQIYLNWECFSFKLPPEEFLKISFKWIIVWSWLAVIHQKKP